MNYIWILLLLCCCNNKKGCGSCNVEMPYDPMPIPSRDGDCDCNKSGGAYVTNVRYEKNTAYEPFSPDTYGCEASDVDNQNPLQ